MKQTKRNVKSKQSSKKTLDIRHSQYLDEITDYKERIDAIKQDIVTIDKSIAEFKHKKNTNNTSDADVDQYVEMLDHRIDLEAKLTKMNNICDETAYLTNTANILYKYYDLIEKGDQFDNELVQNSSSSILKYFSVDLPKQASTVVEKKSENESRGTLLDKYLSCTQLDYIGYKQDEQIEESCTHCGSTNITIVNNDGFISCNECHSIKFIIVDHDKPSYRDPPMECTYFAYKRHNHFNEWIAQVQGKETTEIPDEVYDKILLEIKKQKITNMAELTHEKVREILKRLRINKYYEHSVHILHRLNGCPMPNMPLDLEEKLRTMFKQIQTPFLKHSPADRKNFLSYSYVLHKMMQLLEKDEYLVNFPLLKCREKLHKQDMTWKKICDELGWQFIASL